MDVDGDKRLSTSDGSNTRETVGGTGKYEGMTMTYTVHPWDRFQLSKPERFKAAIIRPAHTS